MEGLMRLNGIRLALYLSGLLAVGYIAWSITADIALSAAVVAFARWVKPSNLF